MELAKLKYFYTVAALGNMTRAAEEIHIAQPALSKAIKLLEEELGVPLFVKVGRGIRLTAYGAHLKRRLDIIFPQLDRIPDELMSLAEQKKETVRLNVLAASTAVTGAVIAYKKEHPHVIFELIQNETESVSDISVVTDAGAVRGAPTARRRVRMPEKIYLAVPKNSPYAALSEIELSQVKDEEFVTLAGSRHFRTICDHFCASAGFKPKISFESDSIIAVKNIIGAGAGVGFWPEYSWGVADAPDMHLVSVTAPKCMRELIVTLHEGASPAAEAFYAHLTAYLEEKRGL